MAQTTISGIKREVSKSEKDDATCYHCGSEFDEIIVSGFNHQFCCEGCKTVYEILDENGLNTYYGIESRPGNKVLKAIGNKYAFLDNEDVKNGLLDFSDGGVSSLRFYVPKIHCSSCIWLLENMHRLEKGIVNSTVNFLKKEVYVVFKSDMISLRQVVELMSSIGYEPVISLDDFKKEESTTDNKTYLYKLGIAGFAFGNIMLLSFPEYFDTNDYLNANFKKLFGYLNLFLATPVLLYSASDYFVSAFKALRKKYFNIDFPISIGIFTLFSRSAYEIISQTGPGFMDSFTMFVFLLLVGKWYQNRTYQALSFERDYKSYFPLAVVKVFGNKEEPVPVGTLEINDLIKLRNQEIIPTDSELISDQAEIDYSFVTGESTPISKKKGDKLFAGGRQLGSTITVKVQAPVSQSYLTRLWNQDSFAKDGSKYQSMVDSVSKYFTIFVIMVALLTLLFWWGSGLTISVKVFTSVLIIACPCALALTLPFSFGNAMTVLGRNRFYLKNSEAIEKLAKIDTIVFDKTGTLTQSGEEEIQFIGNELTDENKRRIYALVSNSTHPLSKAIYAKLSGPIPIEVHDFKEHVAQGISGVVDGAFLKMGSSSFVNYSKTIKNDLSSRVFVQIENEVLGYFVIKKKYRDGIIALIESLKSKSYKLHLISGDNESEMSNLSQVFSENQLHFNYSPQNKLDYVKELQSQGKNVLMVGDGLNDAGALKQANVGLAVSDDVYNFTPACDAILDAKNFTLIDNYMQFSKDAIQIVKMSFGISLFYNSIGMFFAVQGMVTPLFAAILMPISSITVVSFITISIRYIARKKGL
tara:strand:+ start:26749 stop:29181 length:2433 start_codon:yes stop_codon:yes gene_type:complete